MSSLGMGGALHQGASSEWFTPPHIFEALGLQFDLDPCAPEGGVPWVPARSYFTAADDGLTLKWAGKVWLNPPYGRTVPQWTRRLADHGNGVALVFARTDAKWAQLAIARATAVCFLAGRLSFISGDRSDLTGHNAAAPSMLLGYGVECGQAVHDCGLGISFVVA